MALGCACVLKDLPANDSAVLLEAALPEHCSNVNLPWILADI